jgi:hypothetical protein
LYSQAAIYGLIDPRSYCNVVAEATTVCKGYNTSFTVTGAPSFSWSTGATVAIIVVSPSVNTTYSVIGTGTNGCKSSATVSVTVDPCTGLAENELKNVLNIYPNPGNGTYVISASGTIIGSRIEIYNAIGEIIQRKTLTEMSSGLNLNGSANGVYFVRVLKDDQLIGVTRIIKE